MNPNVDESALALVAPSAVSVFSESAFEHAQRIANVYASSQMVPEQYRGNVADCLIAMDLASRLELDPLMLMQHCYMIRGRPGIEAKLMIALLNTRGPLAGPLDFVFEGEGDDRVCTARGVLKQTGEERTASARYGDCKTHDRSGKLNEPWAKHGDQMLRYRAAAFFARAFCPEVVMGFSTVEELRDVAPVRKVENLAATDGRTEFGFGAAPETPREPEQSKTTDDTPPVVEAAQSSDTAAEPKPKRKTKTAKKPDPEPSADVATAETGVDPDAVLRNMIGYVAKTAGCTIETAGPIVARWLTRMGWRDRLGEPDLISVIRAKATKTDWVAEGCVEPEVES